jgi:hypothetical protein
MMTMISLIHKMEAEMTLGQIMRVCISKNKPEAWGGRLSAFSYDLLCLRDKRVDL